MPFISTSISSSISGSHLQTSLDGVVASAGPAYPIWTDCKCFIPVAISSPRGLPCKVLISESRASLSAVAPTAFKTLSTSSTEGS